MQVKITFYSTLRRYVNTSTNCVEMEIPQGSTVQHLLDEFNVIKGEVGLIIVNSELATTEQSLGNNDKIEFYPIVGGG